MPARTVGETSWIDPTDDSWTIPDELRRTKRPKSKRPATKKNAPRSRQRPKSKSAKPKTPLQDAALKQLGYRVRERNAMDWFEAAYVIAIGLRPAKWRANRPTVAPSTTERTIADLDKAVLEKREPMSDDSDNAKKKRA